MNFQWAIQQLKEGKKVRRKDWGNPDFYVFMKNENFYYYSTENDPETLYPFRLECFQATDWELFGEKLL